MSFRPLIIILLFLSNTALAQGRKPAVEDFVGIEVDQPQTPAGSESLYNLEQDMQEVKVSQATVPKKNINQISEASSAPALGLTTLFAALLILGLPLLSWIFVMNRMRSKATQENANNIEVLENYRKNREISKKTDVDKKKAS